MTNAQRLAEAVIERRKELGLGQQALAERAAMAGQRISFQTVRNVESAVQETYRPQTLAALDAGLAWPTGSAARILQGGDPPEAAPPPLPAEPADELATRLARIESRIGLDDRQLNDVNAMEVLLGCLTDQQFEIVARAVLADPRFQAVAI